MSTIPSRRLLVGTISAICLTVLLATYSLRRHGVLVLTGHAREDSSATVSLGKSLLKHGKPRRAIQAVAQIQDGSPEEAEAWMIRGMAYAALQETASSRHALERAWQLKQDPMTAKVLAAIYLAANEHERGLRMLQAAARIDPADFRPWYAMGELVFRRLGRFPEAIQAFRAALRRLPAHLESRIALIEVLLTTHELQQARDLLEALLRERCDDAVVHVLAARLALEAGKPDVASGELDKALAIDSDRREALVLRAQCHFLAGRPESALTDLQHALSLESPTTSPRSTCWPQSRRDSARRSKRPPPSPGAASPRDD